MSALTTINIKPPAPIDPDLSLEVAILTNRLDPAGHGHEIAYENAPGPAQRRALEDRRRVLDAALRACGRTIAATEVGGLVLVLRLRGNKAESEREAAARIELYVKNLADLPTFAVVEACADYQQGRAGDRRWMPEVPELRQHALAKSRTVAVERSQIEAVLTAKIRSPRATPEQRAATVAMARQVITDMRKADADLRDKVRGVPAEITPPFSEKTPKQAEDSLARLARELRDLPPPVLSEECRHITHEGMEIDPGAWDEEQRYRQQLDEQEERAA